MEILRTNKELSKIELYNMTVSPEIKTAKSLEDGATFTVDAAVNFTDQNKNGNAVEILSIRTTEGDVYAVQSSTFRRSFDLINDVITGGNGWTPEQFTIKKISGVSKGGREFIDCVLVGF